MKKSKIVLLLIVTSILLCACPEDNGHDYISIVNNSEKTIACQEFWSGSIAETDSLYQCRIGIRSILPDSSRLFESLNKSWEIDFNLIPFIQFIVMDTETYYKYRKEPCDTIRKYVPILHRYRLTLEDLQQMDWKVIYPPEE